MWQSTLFVVGGGKNIKSASKKRLRISHLDQCVTRFASGLWWHLDGNFGREIKQHESILEFITGYLISKKPWPLIMSSSG